MKFVSNRDIVVRSSKAAMAIRFLKGVPQDVPPRMQAEVIEKGILPVQDDGSAVEVGTTSVVPEEPPVKLAPNDQDERNVAIMRVMRAIVERNDPKDFTGAGMPSAPAITLALGWKVDSKEVKVLWAAHKAELLNKE